ncbi:hypothetical protein [Paucisalibacillus globulus]|uniref:hypothetical protein n=1 Tax=Paucisalibacillus globulus TaxID=351095 RepID=UPI000478C046|nr:hypothetical protein [Paucisalibacillus globulus]
MNKIASAIKVIGWLAIVGGIVLGINAASFEDSFWVFVIHALYGIGIAILVFGFAEIINLLQKKREYVEMQHDVLKDIRYELKLIKENTKRAD